DRPLLEAALHSGFLLLGEDPGREIVFGTVLCRRLPGLSKLSAPAFAALSEPGFCKAVMDFRVAPEEGGVVRLTTETRVFALGDSARRKSAAYWRLIYPGSALIRREWLEAIRRRAEDPIGPCREELQAILHPAEEALAKFESDAGGSAGLAQEALAQARL